MNKLLLGILCFTVFAASAQDLQAVQRSIASNDYRSAKEQIDNYFADKKNINDAPAWYYKARIYTEIGRQQNKTDYTYLQEAFNAYRRYQELDPKNKLMQLNDNVDLFQLYDLAYNTAADLYNDKDYNPAFNHFKIALDVEEYISKRGYSFQGKKFPLLDTALVNLVGSAAYFSMREEEAVPYFERLANAKISGEDYKGIYALLYSHYLKKNDQVRAVKYLSAGKELFPDNGYWFKLEMGNTASAKDRFVRYEQLLQKYPSNFDLMMDYSVELFNYVYDDTKPADFDGKQSRLQLLLAKALNINANSAMANYVMSQHVYNQVYDMEEALSGMKENTPADQSKKKTYVAKLDQKYEELFTYSLKAYELYSQNPDAEAKQNSRKLLNQLIAYYKKRKQTDKANYYQDKLKAL